MQNRIIRLYDENGARRNVNVWNREKRQLFEAPLILICIFFPRIFAGRNFFEPLF